MKQLFLSVALLIWTQNASASNPRDDLRNRLWQFQYDGGDSYRVSFGYDTLTWTAIEGADVGRSETDRYDVAAVSDRVYFISWTEQDSSHVSVVLNLKNLTVHSSGSSPSGNWFRKGIVIK